MGILDNIRGRVGAMKEGVRTAQEDIMQGLSLYRRRTAELTEQALARRESEYVPAATLSKGVAALGNGILARQLDEDTIAVGSQDFSRDELSIPDPELQLTQHDLNSEFTPSSRSAWSCRLGSGNNTLFIAAYDGINEGKRAGERILVIKNASGRILRVMSHPFEKRNSVAEKPVAASIRVPSSVEAPYSDDFADLFDGEGEISLQEGMIMSKKDQNTLKVGDREFSFEQFMRVINPNNRISFEAVGLTEAKILTTYNKLDWSCTLGSGDTQITLTIFELKSNPKYRNVVITDSTGKIRGEISSAIFNSPNW